MVVLTCDDNSVAKDVVALESYWIVVLRISSVVSASTITGVIEETL